MKKTVIRVLAVVLAITVVLLIIFISSCNRNEKKTDTANPGTTVDDALTGYHENAIENSDNVNGARFNTTLEAFTRRYNEAKQRLGETDLIVFNKWQKHGGETNDDNGIKIQYYYYDEENTNFTATVEVESQKLLNIGFGTTMAYYMGQTGKQSNSETALQKAALMAQAACQYQDSSAEILTEIFRQTTTDENETLWFQHCVYKLDTQQDKQDSKNNIMLFRVFPIADRLKSEWKLKEYNPQK